MNKNLWFLILALQVILPGCSMFNRGSDTGITGPGVSPGTVQAISEQRITSDFQRDGVRVITTLLGNVEAIESTGYAPVWGNSENARREAFRMAELEAKKAMNDFINKETITSNVSLEIISRNLEKARDTRTNNFASNRKPDEDIATSDLEVEKTSSNTVGNSTTQPLAPRDGQNIAYREDAVKIASTTRTEIRVQSRGILGGLYLKEGEVINDGRTVRVVYRWDRRNDAHRSTIRNLMGR